MSLSERQRRDIFVRLEPVLGPEAANNLMSVLPHQPASELVTRADLYASAAELKGEMAKLEGQMAEFKAELLGDMAELKAEMRTDMAQLKVDLQTTFQRWMTGAVAANTIAVVIGAADLMPILAHQPANELVTRRDLFATTAEIKGEMAELKAELRTEMAELRVTVQRWMTGAMAANTIAVVTALLT